MYNENVSEAFGCYIASKNYLVRDEDLKVQYRAEIEYLIASALTDNPLFGSLK